MGLPSDGLGAEQSAARGPATGPNPTDRGKRRTRHSVQVDPPQADEAPLSAAVARADCNEHLLVKET